MLTTFLLLMFTLCAIAIQRQFAATARLARWLHEHRPTIWRELDRPGSTLSKGDSDNGYLKRTSALQAMNRLMPLHTYQQNLTEPEALDCLRSHRIWGILSILFMLLFIAGVFFGVVRGQIRPEDEPPDSGIQKGEQSAHGDAESKPDQESEVDPGAPLLKRSAKMKSIPVGHYILLVFALVSPLNGQGKRSIDARVTGWTVHISYSDIDRLPSGSSPVTTVKLSHPSINLRSEMEAPFESFFALWEHLALTSDANPVETPIELPADQDGAVLIEKDENRGEYQVVKSDKALLLIRFWLDTFKHRWVDDPSALTDREAKLNGSFGYLLRHNAFPAEGNHLAKLTKLYKAEQDGAGQPATRSESKSEDGDKPQPEAEGRSR